MHSGLTELWFELLTVVFYGGLTSLFAYGGVLSELSALHQFTAGETAIAVWYLVLGAIAFYAVITIVTDRLVPTVRAVVS